MPGTSVLLAGRLVPRPPRRNGWLRAASDRGGSRGAAGAPAGTRSALDANRAGVAPPSCQQIGGEGSPARSWRGCPLVRVGAGSRADRPEGPPPMPTVVLTAVPAPVPA